MRMTFQRLFFIAAHKPDLNYTLNHLMRIKCSANEGERKKHETQNAANSRTGQTTKKTKLFILFVDAIYFNHFEMCRFNRYQGNNVVYGWLRVVVG